MTLTEIVAIAASVYTTLAAVIGTAALVAAATPTPKDDAIVTKGKVILSYFKKVVDFIGANFGKAKNAS